MARLELARRIEELNMSAGEAKGYGSLLAAVEGHIAQLHDLLESQSVSSYAGVMSRLHLGQIWLRAKRNECGSSGKLTANSMTVVSRKG